MRVAPVAAALAVAFLLSACSGQAKNEYLDQPDNAAILSDRWVNGEEELWEVPGTVEPSMITDQVIVAEQVDGSSTAYVISDAYEAYDDAKIAIQPRELWNQQIPNCRDMDDFPNDQDPVCKIFGHSIIAGYEIYSLEDGTKTGDVPWNLSDKYESMEVYGEGEDSVLILQDPINTFTAYNTNLDQIWQIETTGIMGWDSGSTALPMNVVETDQGPVALIEKDKVWYIVHLRDGSMKELPDQPNIPEYNRGNLVTSYRDGWHIDPSTHDIFLVGLDGMVTHEEYQGPFLDPIPFSIVPEGWKPTLSDVLSTRVDTAISRPAGAVWGSYDPSSDCEVLIGDDTKIDLGAASKHGWCQISPVAVSPDGAVIANGVSDSHVIRLINTHTKKLTEIGGVLVHRDLIITNIEKPDKGEGRNPLVQGVVPKGTIEGNN